MSIQTTEGMIALDSSDWQRTHAGVTFGIKIRSFAIASVTGAFICEQAAGAWGAVENIDSDMTEKKIAAMGGVNGWLALAVNKLNTWLSGRFPNAPQAVYVPAAESAGTLIEQIDHALKSAIRIDTQASWKNVKRIGVIGDSISTRNNGASAVAWPALLESMIKDGGVHGIEIRNYSLPGLTWRTAHTPTAGWLIGGDKTPLKAMFDDGCDVVMVCMGVNDRQNPQALADAQAFKDALGGVPVVYVHQQMYDTECPQASIVTIQEQAVMDSVYAAMDWDGPAGVALAKLYECGMTYDKLHPTDTGKQWIASAVYMWLQRVMPITPIVRNVAWLWALRKSSPEQYAQILNATK